MSIIAQVPEPSIGHIIARQMLGDLIDLLKDQTTRQEERIQQVVHFFIDTLAIAKKGFETRQKVPGEDLVTLLGNPPEIKFAEHFMQYLEVRPNSAGRAERFVRQLHSVLSQYQTARAQYQSQPFRFDSDAARLETFEMLCELQRLADLDYFEFPYPESIGAASHR